MIQDWQYSIEHAVATMLPSGACTLRGILAVQTCSRYCLLLMLVGQIGYFVVNSCSSNSGYLVTLHLVALLLPVRDIV